MNNFNLTFAAILFSFFALTSCQKESMNEMTASTSMTTANNRNLPVAGIHTINELTRTEATLEKGYAQANARAKFYTPVECGSLVRGTTIGEISTFDNQSLPCETGLESFNGPDSYFLLTVKDNSRVAMSYTITLDNLTADMDLFLITLDERGYFLDCKATSITPGLGAETIEVSGLNAGYYGIVVDTYTEHIEGTYSLAVNCTAVSANPPSVESCETFEDYRSGDLTKQSNDWRKKYPTALFDAQVTDQYAVSGKQSMSIKYQNNCQDNHQPSVIYDVAPKTTGHYTMKWNMLVGKNTNGAINLQKFNSVNSDESVDIYIRSEGKLAFKLNGKIYDDGAWAKEGKLPKTHAYNQWMEVTLDINFHHNLGILSIDEEVIAYWDLDAQEDHPVQGAQSFAGVNFKTYSAKSHFIVDDICTEWTAQDRLKENDPGFYDKLFRDATILSLE